MSTATPRAQVPLLAAAQAQKHVTHNEALLEFDALLNARFLDRDLSVPPAVFADGDAYLVKAVGGGAWAGQDGKIAFAVDGAWRFYAPFAGLAAFIADESVMLVYTATGWKDWASVLNFENVPLVGVNTTADATNKFALKANAALFAALEAANGGTGDMRIVNNKEAAGKTASFLFQDNFSGRAEFGLTGDDDFHVKVSPDGAVWYEALKIARAGGAMTLPAGQLQFPATQNPSADANTLDDYEEGTFTPVLTTSATPPSGWTASAAAGEYVKIGTLVFVVVRLLLTSKGTGGSGNARIGGLPFAVRNTANQTTEASPRFSNVTLTAGYTFVIAGFNAGTAAAGFLQIGSGLPAAGFAWDTSLADNSELGITGGYLT